MKDTLDCLTGEVTERIGEVVLDGGENWSYIAQYSDGYIYQYKFKTKSVDVIADKLKNIQLWNNTSGEGIQINDTATYIQIKKANITTSGDFKIWLSQNPITVQYQLATESIKTVDLTCINEQGETVDFMPLEGTMSVETSSDTIQPLLDMDVPVEAITQNLNSFASMEE